MAISNWTSPTSTATRSACSVVAAVSVVKREELFITTRKLSMEQRPPSREAALDYLVLVLMHFPVAFAPGQDNPTTDESEGDHRQGYGARTSESNVRGVVVSKFTMDVCKAIVMQPASLKPAANQVESHPYFVQDAHRVLEEAGHPPCSVFASGQRSFGVKMGQVHIAWGVKHGVSVIPKSVQEGGIKDNSP
ncbi:hypothetical protein EXIGLDRAFT_751393 [Exidia glandulosa HHB12029]|uniref:Uncharacterized protein n=1 Tax=Exidia glandulosa HHB12029 TaxID=1314781 RepID=A0A165FGI4_EXIGL|nr:hypothetical protein EXIGLDRAFT_751393 [Exidia glandulosa HHB12029]